MPVTTTVTVQSPMTVQDYVKAIHVFTEKNPQPNVISIKLGPRAGKAEVQTRIRLTDTQTVTAICEMSDGTFWSDKVDVILTLSAAKWKDLGPPTTELVSARAGSSACSMSAHPRPRIRATP